MNGQYEHEGVVYSEPLPRVVLVSPLDLQTPLVARRHNTKQCGLISPRDGLIGRIDSPAPPHEIDVFIVHDVVRASNGAITWPSGYADTLGSFCTVIVKRGGICVFLSSEVDSNLLGLANLGIEWQPSIKIWPGRSAHQIHRSTYPMLCAFVENHWAQAKTYIAVFRSANVVSGNELIPVATDSSGTIYVGVHPGPDGLGSIIFLPGYSELDEALNTLLVEALPEMAPHLFPFRRDLSWLKDTALVHPSAVRLESEKEAARKHLDDQIAALDKRIHAIKTGDQYVMDLVTTAGDPLKEAVRRVLTELITAAGISDAVVVDADADPSLRGGTDKREDLRVEWREHVFLLNVAGRERFLTPTSLNQASRYQRLYLTATGVSVDRVHSLLVANFDYGQGKDPRRRGLMFGTGTADARERLMAERHGAISTWDLYQILRAVQREEIKLTDEALLRLLTTEGIFDLSVWLSDARSLSDSARSTAVQDSPSSSP
jgi:hypothetical protein